MAKRRCEFDYECQVLRSKQCTSIYTELLYIITCINKTVDTIPIVCIFLFFYCELHIEENYSSYKAYQFTCAFIQNFSRFFFYHAIYDFVRDGIRVYNVHQWNEYQTLYSTRSIRLKSLLYMLNTMVCLILHNVQ